MVNQPSPFTGEAMTCALTPDTVSPQPSGLAAGLPVEQHQRSCVSQKAPADHLVELVRKPITDRQFDIDLHSYLA